MVRVSSMTAAALASLMASGASEAHSPKAGRDQEKCAGIVKAGRNDCGTSRHDCAGRAPADGLAQDWIMLPKGLCKRILGGKPIK